jgi:Zn-dependent protease with chaperone function
MCTKKTVIFVHVQKHDGLLFAVSLSRMQAREAAEEPLTRRGARLVALWAGFYLLAFGMAAVLLLAGYAMAFRSASVSFFSVLAGIGSAFAALVILWASFPRWNSFKPPGPRLDPRQQPRLYEEIRRLSRDLRQKPPAEIYLIADVNAWVSTRGGFIGLFSRRIMAVGLPLLRVLSLSEFRSVLGHEFGHYVAGDVRLGPWIYRTHAALERTIQALEGQDSVWRFPFLAYAKLFTRSSRAMSQRQELAADALAARIGSREAFIRALRLLEEAGSAFPSFVREEMLPVLNAEFRPALCEGFDRYRGSQEVRRQVLRIVERELAERKRDPYRTHPPLHERLDALAALPPSPEPAEDPPAGGLIDSLDGLEVELLAFVTDKAAVRGYPRVSWAEVAERAYLPAWREQAREQQPMLQGIAPEQFLELNLTELGRRYLRGHSDPDCRSAACGALGVALLVGLRDSGWTLHADPGERVAARRGEHRIEPFHVFIDFAEGKLTPEAWKERCRAAEIAGLNLGPKV